LREIKVIGTGLIYRNPKPHVHSIQASFPTVVTMDNGEMLAAVLLGEAFESANIHSNILRSTDGGETWQLEGPIYPGTRDRLTSDQVRITAFPGGEVVAFMVRHDRSDHPEEGLTNHENLGFVPTELLILRSADYGHTWTEPETVVPPVVGPAFEHSSPIVQLKDGRWIWPTSTWRGWNGDCPGGMRVLALVSHDRGKTWPEHMEVMNMSGNRVTIWESKIVELPDGRLLAAGWPYSETTGKDLPNHYAISNDGSTTWTAPMSTGLIGQTLTPFVLDDGRVLSVYRRIDKPGLWANVSHLEGDAWVNDSATPMWGTQAAGLTTHSENMAQNFTVLRFGSPSVTRLPDGVLFVSFWCYEDCVCVCRWFKLGQG
jgi:sialidase-1